MSDPQASPRPLVIAHRGASREAAENTLAAFALAWQRGADAIEGDFRLTADAQVVCFHDERTGRVADRDLLVESSTLAELRTLDVAARHPTSSPSVIPTLAEVLAILPTRGGLYLEVKGGPGLLGPIFTELEAGRCAPERLTIIAFDPAVIREGKRRWPELRALWLCEVGRDASGRPDPCPARVLSVLRWCRADGLSTNAISIDRALVREVIDAGFSYHVWTVDDPAMACRCAAWGVASITTNVPDRIVTALARQAEAGQG